MQCAIPVFDGLLPEPHNTKILRLIFTCAHWHALAKLRLHSDITVNILDEVTTILGEQFRHFANQICPLYDTDELPREAGARQRRAQKAGTTAIKPLARRSVKKKFQLHRYKHHCLGDYVDAILCFGTIDSFTSAIVSDVQTKPRDLPSHNAYRASPNIAHQSVGTCEPTARQSSYR